MKHTKFITLTVGMFFALSSFGNTSEDPLKIVQKSILEDPLMEQNKPDGSSYSIDWS